MKIQEIRVITNQSFQLLPNHGQKLFYVKIVTYFLSRVSPPVLAQEKKLHFRLYKNCIITYFFSFFFHFDLLFRVLIKCSNSKKTLKLSVYQFLNIFVKGSHLKILSITFTKKMFLTYFHEFFREIRLKKNYKT